MKKLLFLGLLGFTFLSLIGCEEENKTETAPAMKCEAGKCAGDMGKASTSTVDGKCAQDTK